MKHREDRNMQTNTKPNFMSGKGKRMEDAF